MKMKDFMMLIVSTPRSKAYLQGLVKNNLFPSYIIILDDKSKPLLPGQIPDETCSKSSKNMNVQKDKKYFDVNESLSETIKKHGIDSEICNNIDVNSDYVFNRVKKRHEKYIIYSGFGGVILRKKILNCGKKILHIHPGKVPYYRGSTPIYYSIINEDKCFASAFFLEEKIDQGSVIKIKEYSVPKNGEIIDYIYDPYIRSNLLVEVLKDYLKNKGFETSLQEKDGETYFIIHPVLKHIAILSCNKEKH